MRTSHQQRRRIYLLRHGAVAYFPASGTSAQGPAVPDPDAVPLTEDGRAQARAAGRALHGVPVDRVVTSGLRRTEDTARLVLDANDGPRRPPVEAWPALREFEPGSPLGFADDELDDAFTRAFRRGAAHTDSYLGGETVGSLVDRVDDAVDRMLSDAWSTALLVLHGGVNRAILSRALIGRGGYLGPLEQSACCVNVLDVDVDGGGRDVDWQVRAVNVTPYDPVPTGPRISSIERMVAEYRALRDGAGPTGESPGATASSCYRDPNGR